MVSIIVPHRDGLEIIKTCVNSLLASDYPRKEIIIVDNSSTDGSPDFLVKEYGSSVRVLRNNVNRYYAGALNMGVRVARGCYIVFLNNDTRVAPTYLSKLVAFMESDSSVGAAQGLVLAYDSAFGKLEVSRLRYGDENRRPFRTPGREGQEVFFTDGAAMIVRKELFEGIGGFDEDLVIWWEEVDLCWRIWLAGYKCKLVRDALVYHKGKATSSRLPEEFSAFHFWKNRFRLAIKYLAAGRLLTVFPTLIFLDVLAALNQLPKKRTLVTAATLRAVVWNFQHVRETLRWRGYVRHRVEQVPRSSVYGMSRRHILVIR